MGGISARDHLDGITVFKPALDRSPEQMVIDQMGTIDTTTAYTLRTRRTRPFVWLGAR